MSAAVILPWGHLPCVYTDFVNGFGHSAVSAPVSALRESGRGRAIYEGIVSIDVGRAMLSCACGIVADVHSVVPQDQLTRFTDND